MQYVVTAAFLLAIVATSFAAVILGGYGDILAALKKIATPVNVTKIFEWREIVTKP